MSYAQSATDGNFVGMMRFAVLNGALWAIGSSWSTAIRSVTLEMIPSELLDVQVSEILAATITTLIALAVSYVTACPKCSHRPSPETEDGRVAATRPRPARI